MGLRTRKLLAVRDHRTPVDGALLLLRLVAGLAFMFHGWGKIQNPFGWMGPDGFAPAFLQGLAALSEFGGGLAWMIGLAMPLASLGIGATMAVAVTYHVAFRGDPFVAMGGGPSYELAAVYLCLALLMLAAGPGRFSLDRLLFGRRG
jgi:putative oxidoreductase